MPVMSARRAIAARLPALARPADGEQDPLEREQLAQRRAPEPGERGVEARPRGPHADQRALLHDAQAGRVEEVARVAAREPAQGGVVEDAVLAAGAATPPAPLPQRLGKRGGWG